MKRVPLYRQLEANDCGLACIQMVSAYYGKPYSLKTIKEHCDLTRLGVSIKDIVHCCKKIGFSVVSVSINLSEIRRIPCPAILFFKKGHFVVLENVSCKNKIYTYFLVDPEYGRIKVKEIDFIEKWISADNGLAIVLSPEDDFLNINKENDYNRYKNHELWKSIKEFYIRHSKNSIKITALTSASLLANWAMPLLFQKTIDDGINNKDIHIVWILLICQLFFFIGYMVSSNLSNLFISKLGLKVDIELMSKYLDKLIKLPMICFDTKFKSDYIQRLSDQSRIRNFLVDNIYGMLFTVLNILVFSTILFVFNYKVFVFFVFFTFLSFFYTIFFLKQRKCIDYSLFSLDSEKRNTIYELIMGMSEIKINNAQQIRISVWENIQKKINILRLKLLYINYYLSGGYNFFTRLRDIIITGICAFLVIKNQMTIGTMMMISYLLGQLTGPVEQLITYSKAVIDTKLSYDRLSEVYEKEDEDETGKIKMDNYKLERSIVFANVSFKYPGTFSPYIINNIDFLIPIGKVTAIVGASGSGKTTLLKLILAFYPPTHGIVRLDDVDLCKIELSSWRDKCGVVMQDGYVFSGTLAENIALSDKSPDINKLKYSVKIACLDRFVERLPMGFNTRVGETGISMSGGEKQRMFIARAVYKNPEFIFFDEATSSLDANNERMIMNNLEQFYKNKTVIIIAHRLSTVKKADNIVFLNNGKIAEQGNHFKLLEKKGKYYDLVKNQLELNQ